MNHIDMRQQLALLGNGAHALAIQILGNREDAADAVQDAFTTVLARPGAFNEKKGRMKPWFLRVVRNRCIDLLRRDYLDLSYAEIAAVLDIAPGTVMSRLHRARMALKNMLEQKNG
jgi:DNA-directed RNA polymerase specialized sigma24 family protein